MDIDRAVVRAAKQRRGQALLDSTSTPAVVSAGCTDIVPSVQGLATALSTSTYDTEAVRVARREAEHSIASSLKVLRETASEKARQAVREAVPGLSDVAGELKCQASTKRECVSMWFFSAAKHVPRLVDDMVENNRKLLDSL
eukprot:7004641-Pyramimonas_sp.AAC.1